MFKVTWARQCVFGCMHGRLHLLNGRTAQRFVAHGSGGRATRLFLVHDLVGMRVRMDMLNNIGGKEDQQGYICSLSSSLVSFLLTFSFLIRGKTISHTCIEKTPFFLS